MKKELKITIELDELEYVALVKLLGRVSPEHEREKLGLDEDEVKSNTKLYHNLKFKLLLDGSL